MMSAGQRLTSVYDSVRFVLNSSHHHDPLLSLLSQSNSQAGDVKVPVRRSRWYPEVGLSSAVPDLTRIKSSTDHWNLQYKPVTRWTLNIQTSNYI